MSDSIKEISQKIVLGASANVFASIFTNPMDLVKVRQQLQNSQASPATYALSNLNGGSTSIHLNGSASKPKATNWARTLGSMVREEGITSCWKGFTPAMLREISYSGIRFGIYDSCKTGVCVLAPTLDKDSFGIKVLAGMVSGAIGSAVATPADILKVKMQAFGATGTLRNHVENVYKINGYQSFFRGLTPTVVRASVLTAAQLGTYDEIKHKLINDFGIKDGFKNHLASSGIAGFVCSAVSAPIDTIKVRMMADVANKYKGALHCTAVLIRNEGPLALYSGATMCFLRLWPQSVISLVVFEYLRGVTGMKTT